MHKILKKIRWYGKQIKYSGIESWYVFCLNNMALEEKNILLQSKYGEDLEGNIFYILKELAENYKDYKLYLAYRKHKKAFYDTLLKKYKIKNVNLVELHHMEYWKLLATCKYLVNDTTFRAGFKKRKGQIYLNTWHGIPLKNMGLDDRTEGYLFGNVQLNIFVSDYFICPNRYMSEIMARAYKLDNLFQGEIIETGYPRNAIFFNNKRAAELKKELGIEGKHIISYMPTWRLDSNKEYKTLLLKYLEEIDECLTDGQIFFVKLHPLTKKQLELEQFKHIQHFPEDYETYDFLNIADCLVTDYSSVMFDFSCSHRQIVLFTYDEEEYLKNRGMYIDLNKLPFPKVKTVPELMAVINSDKNYQENAFIKSIIESENINAAENMCKILLYGQGDYNVFKIFNNQKDNVLIFVDNLLTNGITSSVFNLVNAIDLNKRNYFFVFRGATVKKNKDKLLEIPPEIGVLSLNSVERTYTELIASYLYYILNINNTFINNIVENCYKRNFIKYYGNMRIDYFVQFVGYGRDALQLFLQAPKKFIFVHNDMKREISVRKVQHKHTIEKCYQRYDTVVGISRYTEQIAKEIAHGKGNYKIVHNCFDYKQVKDNALKPLKFDLNTECICENQNGLLGILNDETARKFITIGRFSPEKGHLRLIDAFDMYWQENNNSFLIVIGGHGVLFSKTVNYAKSKSCWRNIIIIKSITNPMPILKKCDLFVLSSSYEGLPVVLFEAACLNIPILCTDIAGTREVLTTYGGGMLVKESAEALYEGMKAFDRCGIGLLDIDYEKYNQQCITEFESLFG